MTTADVLPIELYGAPTGNCLRAAVALEVLGIPYVAKAVDLRSLEHMGPEFLALNAFGRVPVMVDRSGAEGPFVLTQSNAILLHVCDMRPGVLLPDEYGDARARVLERFFYFVTDVIAPNYSSFFLASHGSREGAGTLAHLFVEGIIAADRFLDDCDYVAGDAFTIADVVGLTIVLANRQRVDWKRAPRLAEWLGRVTARSDVQRGLAAFSYKGLA